MNKNKSRLLITIERTFKASPGDVWELWTTKEGLESWWGPEGFTTKVLELDVRIGGKLRYAMTAIGDDQREFMKNAGLPLTTEAKIAYTEVIPRKRLAYKHLADFIPGIEPYEVATLVEFFPGAHNVRMALKIEPMHNEEWTLRSVMGHESQLGKLEKLIRGGEMDS